MKLVDSWEKMRGAVGNCDLTLYSSKGTGQQFSSKDMTPPHMVVAPFIHQLDNSGILLRWKPMHAYWAHGYMRGEVLSFFCSEVNYGCGRESDYSFFL